MDFIYTHIEELRKKSGKTQEQVAEALKISRPNYIRLVKRGESLSLIKLQQIANALECTLEAILIPYIFKQQNETHGAVSIGDREKAKAIKEILDSERMKDLELKASNLKYNDVLKTILFFHLDIFAQKFFKKDPVLENISELTLSDIAEKKQMFAEIVSESHFFKNLMKATPNFREIVQDVENLLKANDIKIIKTEKSYYVGVEPADTELNDLIEKFIWVKPLEKEKKQS